MGEEEDVEEEVRELSPEIRHKLLLQDLSRRVNSTTRIIRLSQTRCINKSTRVSNHHRIISFNRSGHREVQILVEELGSLLEVAGLEIGITFRNY